MLNLTVFSLLLFHKSSKEDRESQSLVPCVYQYPYVNLVKNKNSINKVTNNLSYINPPKVSIDNAIYQYCEFLWTQ